MSAESTDAEFEALLEYLKQNRGFDFTGYKRTTLRRRVQKRMETLGVDGFAGYRERLVTEPDEFTPLFDTLLINVTRFFRDEAPWQELAEHVIPTILARVPDSQPIRVWSAGCASGEEAYTLAMLFAEAMGMDRFRERVKIYATDADERALAEARQASYSEEQVAGIPEALRERYMERVDSRSVFRKDLRRSVIFGRNDLVQDAPISRIDLLVCRNTLMYFTAETQASILARFHFALVEGGVLFLGRAETLLTQTSVFVPIGLKWRLFGKVPRPMPRERLALVAPPVARIAEDGAGSRIREAAFEAGGESQIVINRAGVLVMANERARQTFGLVRADLGRPIQDLEVSYRPAELRSLIERAYAERTRVSLREVQWRPRQAMEDMRLTIEVCPLSEGDGSLTGVSVLFSNVTEAYQLQHALAKSKENLETAYEELKSTNEELETTNEELQSTVEELETTNEELQSTNEELETMNEELRSTNTELQTMNDELRRRGEELNELNDFLAAVFASMRGGVVVLDTSMRVLVWNGQSEDMWGVRASEVLDTNFFGLDIGFPVDQLAARVRAALRGLSEEDMSPIAATNRRGRSIVCRVTCAPLRSVKGIVRGVIVTMEEQEHVA